MSAQNTSTLKDEPLSPRASASLKASQARGAAIPELNDKGRMADIPLSPEAKITVERRGEIVLIGINRPKVYNRFDPDAFFGLAKAYYDFDNDPSLRAPRPPLPPSWPAPRWPAWVSGWRCWASTAP
jgi:hypothetical protein